MKFYIRTYGCQMNERDSEAAGAMLMSNGHLPVAKEEDADLIILNTCSVRDQAERKAIGKLGFLNLLKKNKPNLKLGIMGCMAQSRGEELVKQLPYLDFALGTDRYNQLPDLVSRLSGGCRMADVMHDDISDAEGLDSHTVTGFKAYISIMRGCDRFCSYCIVPYVRGRERSRTPEKIIDEAKALADAGVKEIMLLGQNVTAYGAKGLPDRNNTSHSPFADLLEQLAKISGIERIRFTSPHPAYFNDRLIDCIAAEPKICKYVHLPLQSGSDRILKKMNRPYTAEQYLSIARKLREKCCGEIALSTDVIVGFPTETEEEFSMTRNVMNEVGYDLAYIFKYSPRRGTVSAKTMEDDVPQQVKENRNQILLADLEVSSAERNRRFLGRTLEVLAEGPSKRNPARWSGRSDQNHLVIFKYSEGIKPGDKVYVPIKRATSVTLFGEVD